MTMNNSFIQVDYAEFIENKKYQIGEPLLCSELFIYNPKPIVFPVLEFEEIPYNGIKFEIPNWIGKYKNLESLSLIGLYIDHLPKELEDIRNLKKLKLGIYKNTNLESFTKEIAHLKSLKILDITMSDITEKQFLDLKRECDNLNIVLFDSIRSLKE